MAGASFELYLSDEALAQLRALPKELRQRLGERLNDLEARFQGDIKKLAGAEKKYRLRVGNHRVLFRLAGNRIQVYAVEDRKEAYE
jgi:mRNA-degrading endonuclease RelE of RelBE toxin-antitoxin system